MLFFKITFFSLISYRGVYFVVIGGKLSIIWMPNIRICQGCLCDYSEINIMSWTQSVVIQNNISIFQEIIHFFWFGRYYYFLYLKLPWIHCLHMLAYHILHPAGQTTFNKIRKYCKYCRNCSFGLTTVLLTLLTHVH